MPRYVEPQTPGPAVEILIVDDEHEVAREVADGLAEEGYVCAVAGSAAEAIAAFAAAGGSLRAIVSDVRMPGVSGPALVRRLQALITEAQAMEFVFVTADLKSDEARDVASLGPVEVVRKPFRWAELAAAVGRAMATAAARRAAAA